VGVAQQEFCKVKMVMLFQTIMQRAHLSFPQMNMTAIMLTLALQSAGIPERFKQVMRHAGLIVITSKDTAIRKLESLNHSWQQIQNWVCCCFEPFAMIYL
jgi:hypothetical protein